MWNSLERGEDSTGIYSPKNGLKKCLLKGSEFVVSPDYNIQLDNVFMAHVRSSTVGLATNVKNAHPFVRGNWILQHNGTLKNHWALARKYDLKYADYDVDSDILAGSIEKTNNFEPLGEIDGGAAVIIQNTERPNKLYVFRNNDRPLFYGMFEEGMYISSIKESLELIHCKDIKEFDKDFLYTIQNGSIIKKPILIVNTPVITTTNSSISNKFSLSDYEKNRLVGAWLRASQSQKFIHTKSEIVKGERYLVKGVNQYGLLNMYDPYTELVTSYTHTLFEINDNIKSGMLCKSLFNIVDSLNKEDVKIKNSEVVYCNADDYKTSKLTLLDPKTKKFKACADKEWFIALTVEEEIEFNKKSSIILLNDDLPFKDNESSNLLTSDKDITSNNDSNNDLEEDIPQDEYFEDLSDHFQEMDQLLEGLNELVVRSPGHIMEIKHYIAQMLDLNFTAHNKFLEYEEEQEEEVVNAGE